MSDDRLYDKAELAEWLGVPESWVRDAITARSIPITWVGRHARFAPEDRAAIVAAGHEAPARVRVLAGHRAPVVALDSRPRRRSA